MRITSSVTAIVLLMAGVTAACSGAAKNRPASQVDATTQTVPAELLAGERQARASFADGAPSVGVLMDEFVQALTRKDMEALNRLRVSKIEYVDLIVPGTVPVGKPPRQVSEKP